MVEVNLSGVLRKVIDFDLKNLVLCLQCILIQYTSVYEYTINIEEGFIQKRRQSSSLLFGEQN